MLVATSAQFVHLLANSEAVSANAGNIEPAHLWMGVLKLVDPCLKRNLDLLGLPEEAQGEVLDCAKKIRHYLEINVREAATRRHALRQDLRGGDDISPPAVSIAFLHRSQAAKDIYSEAERIAAEQGTASLSARHLAEALVNAGMLRN